MRYARKSLTASAAAALCLALSAKDKLTVETFGKRVKDYVALREGVEGKMPKLSKDATPEQIEAHKKAFQERVRAARAGAKQGRRPPRSRLRPPREPAERERHR